MDPSLFNQATDDVLNLIVDQAHERLSNQCQFAAAQETRANSLIGYSVSLAGVATTIAIGAFNIGPKESTFLIGGAVASLGFTLSAALGLWAFKAKTFNATGYYPTDFLGDVAVSKSSRLIKQDIAADYQIRLEKNKRTLHVRGWYYNIAVISLLVSPVLALVFAMVIGTVAPNGRKDNHVFGAHKSAPNALSPVREQLHSDDGKGIPNGSDIRATGSAIAR